MRVKRISRRGLSGCSAQKSRAAWRRIWAQRSLGKPKMPELIAGSATTSDLPREVAERLDTIAAACTDCVIHLDDVDRTRGYYTGLRFRAYDAASRSTIAQGGRYDNLYEKFGASAPAVGFTITCE